MDIKNITTARCFWEMVKNGERVDQAILHCCKRVINLEPEKPANDTPKR